MTSPSAKAVVPRPPRGWQGSLWQCTLAACVGPMHKLSAKLPAASTIPTTPPPAGWVVSPSRAGLGLPSRKPRSPPPHSFLRSRCSHERAKFHAPARGLHARPPRSSFCSPRRPHPPALSRAFVSLAAVPTGIKREGRRSRGGPQRRRPFGIDVPRSPRFAAKDAQAGRRSPLAKPPHLRTRFQLDYLAGSTLFVREILKRPYRKHRIYQRFLRR